MPSNQNKVIVLRHTQPNSSDRVVLQNILKKILRTQAKTVQFRGKSKVETVLKVDSRIQPVWRLRVMDSWVRLFHKFIDIRGLKESQLNLC